MRQANRITILTQMIDLRRLPAFQHATEATEPYHHAWQVAKMTKPECPEERILEITEVAYVLQADGFPVPEIFKRLGRVYGPPPSILDRSTDPLRDYLVDHLRAHSPEYLKLGVNLLNAGLALAMLWAEIYATRLISSSWPPPEMLAEGGGGSIEALDELMKGGAATDARRLKARAIPGDEVRGYSTGGLSWGAMMGSAGVALVREGRSIDHVETMMN